VEQVEALDLCLKNRDGLELVSMGALQLDPSFWKELEKEVLVNYGVMVSGSQGPLKVKLAKDKGGEGWRVEKWGQEGQGVEGKENQEVYSAAGVPVKKSKLDKGRVPFQGTSRAPAAAAGRARILGERSQIMKDLFGPQQPRPEVKGGGKKEKGRAWCPACDRFGPTHAHRNPNLKTN
jgi:hypothetical protein